VRLSPAEVNALRQFREGLAFLGERMRSAVLFGSRARNEGHEDSDLDVLVLVEDSTPADRARILDLAYDVELDSGLVLAPIVREAGAWPTSSSLCAEIARDGVPL
jgi:predicted nucleotidyltransferase